MGVGVGLGMGLGLGCSEADMAGGMYSRVESTRGTPPSRVAWFLLAEESAQCSPAPSLKDQWPRTTWLG